MRIKATITTEEIREHWTRMIATRSNPTKQGALGHWTDNMLNMPESQADDFYGATGEQTSERLTNGYTPEGEISGSFAGGADQILPEMIFDEDEGDFMLDACLNGEDFYRVQWEDVPVPQGVTITAQVNMLASTPAKVLAEYTDFIGRAIATAEGMGSAPALQVTHVANQVYGREGLELTIPLVEQGESVDPVAWNAFLAPGSFRTLGFLARGIIGDRLGKKLSWGMGSSAGEGWNVTREGDEIRITCPPSAREFPRELMEGKLAEVFSA